jgi:predicted metal-dependent hydrolase
LEIRPDIGLTVIIPRRCPVSFVNELLQQKSRWVLRTLARQQAASLPPPRRELQSGDTVAYLGRDLQVCCRPAEGRNARVKMEGDRLLVNPGPFRKDIYRLVEVWYRQQARILFPKKIQQINSYIGVRYNTVTIRGQKTRWGSCSRNGNISLNWKLMMVPEPVLDYVIIHELTHLKEMNHSAGFWQQVAEHCPNWREYRKYLNDHPILRS